MRTDSTTTRNWRDLPGSWKLSLLSLLSLRVLHIPGGQRFLLQADWHSASFAYTCCRQLSRVVLCKSYLELLKTFFTTANDSVDLSRVLGRSVVSLAGSSVSRRRVLCGSLAGTSAGPSNVFFVCES